MARGPPRGHVRTGLCTLATTFRRGSVHRFSRRRRLCTLRTMFRRGFVHLDGVVLYKPPRKRPLQCAKSGFVHWRPCLDGGLYTGLLDTVGYVHCGPCLGGTLYTDRCRHCTNPLRNVPSSVQSPVHSSGHRIPEHPLRSVAVRGPAGGMLRLISRAARREGAAGGRRCLSTPPGAGEFAALPRPCDERPARA